jgi:hypothetical protein
MTRSGWRQNAPGRSGAMARIGAPRELLLLGLPIGVATWMARRVLAGADRGHRAPL